MKVKTTIHIERGEDEIELNVSGHYTPVMQGRYSGPPEDCYPSEPSEAEVDEITLVDGKPFVFASSEEEKEVTEKAVEALLEEGDNTDWGPDEPDDDGDY